MFKRIFRLFSALFPEPECEAKFTPRDELERRHALIRMLIGPL